MPDSQSREPEFESPFATVSKIGHFSFTSQTPLFTQMYKSLNQYLAIASHGNVSDLVMARNCCLARMLPGEAENGVGMNRSVREGKKSEAL